MDEMKETYVFVRVFLRIFGNFLIKFRKNISWDTDSDRDNRLIIFYAINLSNDFKKIKVYFYIDGKIKFIAIDGSNNENAVTEQFNIYDYKTFDKVDEKLENILTNVYHIELHSD